MTKPPQVAQYLDFLGLSDLVVHLGFGIIAQNGWFFSVFLSVFFCFFKRCLMMFLSGDFVFDVFS